MPFDESVPYGELGGQSYGGLRVGRKVDAPKKYSQLDQGAAAFESEHVVGSFVRDLKSDTPPTYYTGQASYDQHPIDPDFDPISLVPEDLREFSDTYVYANTPDEVGKVTAALRHELNNQEILAGAGASGFMWNLLAAGTSPEMLMPVGGQIGKGKGLGTALARFAGAGFVGTSASEALLQQTQHARTVEMSMMNIAAGTLLSAGFGGAIHGVSKIYGDGKAFTAAKDIIAADMKRATSPDVDAVTVPAKDGDTSIGAAEVSPEVRSKVEAEELEFEGVYKEGAKMQALEKVGDVTPVKAFQNPVKRLLESELLGVRKLVQKIQDPSLVLNKNVEGEANVVSAYAEQRMWRTKVAKAASFADDQYIQYVQGRSVRFAGVARSTLAARLSTKNGDVKLTYGEFRDAVGKAMRDDDSAERLVREGLIPETARAAVETSAKKYRAEVYDPILKELQALGHLPEDMDVKTAASYLNRIYDRVELAQNSEKSMRFLDEVEAWLGERQGESIERMKTFDAERAKLKDDIQFLQQKIRATGESADEAAAKAIYERISNDLEELTDVSNVMDALSKVMDESGTAAPGKKLKTDASMSAAAIKAARKAYLAKLRNSLTDDVADIARQAGDDAIEGTVADIVNRLDDMSDDDALAFILKETPKPIARDVIDTVDQEFASGMVRAELEAQHAAAAAYDNSLKAQLKRQVRDGTHDGRSPEQIEKELMAMFRKVAKAEARKAGKKASTKVTKALKEELNAKVKELKERTALHRRDDFDSEMDAEDFRSIASTLKSRITKTGGELGYDLSVPSVEVTRSGRKAPAKASVMKERKFMMPDQRLEFILVNDVEQAAGLYANAAGGDLALLRKFGTIDPLKMMDDIEFEKTFADMERAVEGKGDKAFKQVTDLKAQTKKDIEEMVNSFRGQHGVPENPGSWGSSTIRNLKRYNYVTKLGGMTVSAIPDVAKLPAVHGYEQMYGKLLKPLIQRSRGLKLAKKELKQLSLITEIHDNTRSRHLEGISGDAWHYNKVDKAMSAMSDTFGLPSLMAPWNQAWKTSDALVTMGRLIDIAKKEVAGGKLTKEETIFSRQNFIGAKESKTITEQIAKHGEMVDGVMLPNVEKWDKVMTDSGYMVGDVFSMGIQRQADITITSPDLEMPAVMRTELGGLLLQFKAFAMITIPKTTQRLAQGSNARAVSAVSTMVGLGMFAYMSKTLVAGKELSDDPKVWIAEGIDRSGLLGIYSDVSNILDKMNIGPRALAGMEQASRYQSRNIIGSLMGPSFGTASAVVGVATGATGTLGSVVGRDGANGWSDSDTDTMKRLVPYNNLFYLNALYNNATKD